MADHTITINESISVFGLEPANKWNAFDWGEKWGYGNTEIVHTIFQSLDDAAIPNVITFGDSISLRLLIIKTINESMTFSSSLDEVTLKDSNGYNYIFTTPTENSEDAPGTSWTPSSDPSTTYVPVSRPSTSWGDA